MTSNIDEVILTSRSGWALIENAPKDGTELLCFHPGLGMGQMVLSWFDGGWREKANMMRLKTDPTHWQPLPSPPTTSLTDKGE